MPVIVIVTEEKIYTENHDDDDNQFPLLLGRRRLPNRNAIQCNAMQWDAKLT